MKIFIYFHTIHFDHIFPVIPSRSSSLPPYPHNFIFSLLSLFFKPNTLKNQSKLKIDKNYQREIKQNIHTHMSMAACPIKVRVICCHNPISSQGKLFPISLLTDNVCWSLWHDSENQSKNESSKSLNPVIQMPRHTLELSGHIFKTQTTDPVTLTPAEELSSWVFVNFKKLYSRVFSCSAKLRAQDLIHSFIIQMRKFKPGS